jgi:integrating conjugative element protein (TIGR03749 family)
MRPNHYFFFCAVLMMTAQAAIADVDADRSAAQRIVWNKQPIAVQLNIGDERRIQFRAPVSVGLPAALQGMLRVQTVNGTVYLLSQRAFPKIRLLVRELGSGQTYLLDVTAVENNGEMPPIVVHLPRDSMPTATIVTASSPPGYVSLTRFAAQQLYAPERLLTAMQGMHRVPIQDKTASLIPGKAVQATPLIAWRAGDLNVTAVELQNHSKRAQILDPRRLRGHWLSATFQHARLLPNGTDADTTAVYLVSAQPFAASF